MPTQVIFHGTQAEAEQMVTAFAHHCECDIAKQYVCNGHKAMLESQRFVDSLLFMRRIRGRLVAGEWQVPYTGDI